jgi:hypothetical protein
MRKFLLILFLFLFNFVQSQELNCTVSVNFAKITNANAQIFKNLEQSLNDFINKTVWTEKAFQSNERINCSMFITIESFSGNNFTASIQVQSSRPIYNSTYSSSILNINDKDFSFSYVEFENLIFNPNSFDSNLISVVAFYSYIILGLDAESFAPSSGEPYFQSAQNIVSLAMPTSNRGWMQTEKKQNRFYLINDLMSPTFKPFKDALYLYHYAGLDTMHKDLQSAKEEIKMAINAMVEMNSTRPNAYLTRIFFDAKADEIVSIFSGGPSIKITDLLDNLNKMSPTNSSKWSQIKL